ncbi:DUF5667 domain-containing protein [Nonomuraea fastidiosa]|jgi:hypothetical protein|uniref:DUF5667 domain-containing protein n=1 Tax=Nonomuraea TaxID=83681 RepID=UPI00325090DA
MSSARERRERVLMHLDELRRLPIGGLPEPAFKERLRAELLSGALATAEPDTPGRLAEDALRTAGPGRETAVEARGRRRRSRGRPLLSQLATVGLVAALMVSSFATYRAVPGDSLYPLKRAAESTLVRLTSDDAERAARELDSAKTRAKEVATLLGSSNNGPLVGKTLKDMEESTRAGISRLKRAEPRSPKIKKFARDQKKVVEPMIEQLNEAEQVQAQGYLSYIEGLVAPE